MSKQWFEDHVEERKAYRQKWYRDRPKEKRKPIIRECANCKVNAFEIDVNVRGSLNRKYCAECTATQRRDWKRRNMNKNRANVTYSKIFNTLTKNYILFVEGVRK